MIYFILYCIASYPIIFYAIRIAMKVDKTESLNDDDRKFFTAVFLASPIILTLIIPFATIGLIAWSYSKSLDYSKQFVLTRLSTWITGVKYSPPSIKNENDSPFGM